MRGNAALRPSRLFAMALAVVVTSAVAPGVVWNVSDVAELNYAMEYLGSGDEVVLGPGQYELDAGFTVNASNVTIRGATGNREQVVVYGGGMNDPTAIGEAFQLAAADQTIRDLTISGFFYNGIRFCDGADQARVSNVKTLNIGERHMKGVMYCDAGVIENCLLEQTQVRQNGFGMARPDDYVGGIELRGATNWSIRDNVVIDIIGSDDGGDGGVFLWNECQNCLIERNVVIGCCKQIELGNPSDHNAWQVQNTVVRNNFILRRPDEDIGIALCYTKDCRVYHNTVYSTGDPGSADWGRTIHIYDNANHPTTNLDIRNNIILGGVLDNSTGDWSAAAIAAMGNIVDTAGTLVAADWFVDPNTLDLHLTALATAAIDAAQTLPEVPEDIDGDARPIGAFPDLGADEYIPEPASLLLFGVASLVAAARRRRERMR